MIRDRIYEIAPDEEITVFSEDQLIKECNVAFKIIGYEPKNLENSVSEVFKSTYKSSNLADFILGVWLVDNAQNGGVSNASE